MEMREIRRQSVYVYVGYTNLKRVFISWDGRDSLSTSNYRHKWRGHEFLHFFRPPRRLPTRTTTQPHRKVSKHYVRSQQVLTERLFW